MLHVVVSAAAETCNNAGNILKSVRQFSELSLVAVLALAGCLGSSNNDAAIEYFRTQPLDTGSVSELLLGFPCFLRICIPPSHPQWEEYPLQFLLVSKGASYMKSKRKVFMSFIPIKTKGNILL